MIMKLRERLRLLYWFIFQDGIQITQERIKDLELKSYESGITKAENSLVITNIEKLVVRMLDVEMQLDRSELVKWIKSELEKLQNQIDEIDEGNKVLINSRVKPPAPLEFF